MLSAEQLNTCQQDYSDRYHQVRSDGIINKVSYTLFAIHSAFPSVDGADMSVEYVQWISLATDVMIACLPHPEAGRFFAAKKHLLLILSLDNTAMPMRYYESCLLPMLNVGFSSASDTQSSTDGSRRENSRALHATTLTMLDEMLRSSRGYALSDAAVQKVRYLKIS